MKKLVFLFVLCVVSMSFSSKTVVEELLSNNCENMASQYYYYILDQGGSQGEANAGFHNAYMSCCFGYPQDCVGGITNL
jgi:hypothetical protein